MLTCFPETANHKIINEHWKNNWTPNRKICHLTSFPFKIPIVINTPPGFEPRGIKIFKVSSLKIKFDKSFRFFFTGKRYEGWKVLQLWIIKYQSKLLEKCHKCRYQHEINCRVHPGNMIFCCGKYLKNGWIMRYIFQEIHPETNPRNRNRHINHNKTTDISNKEYLTHLGVTNSWNH